MANFNMPAWYSPLSSPGEWALSELWRSWGVEPRIVLGHSLGEYVAATVAGVMTPRMAFVCSRAVAALPKNWPKLAA